MDKVLKVNINEIKDHLASLAAFNSVPLERCELYENGRLIEIPDDVLERWRFIGLNNSCFIESEFHKAKKISDLYD